MYFVQCPDCGSPVEIPADAVGPERTDLFNVVNCDNCDLTFDYADEDVQQDPNITGAL